MKAKKQKRIFIVAEWLRNEEINWWFYAQALKLHTGPATITLIGNGKVYNETDRSSLSGHAIYILKTFLFSVRLCFVPHANDVLFTWNQLPALLPALLLRLTGVQRTLICQNFLYRPSKSACADFFRKRFYNFVLGYKHLYISLQSEELMYYYKHTCGLKLQPGRCYFVRDCLPENRVPLHIIQAGKVHSQTNGYIFTGGEANRDWKLVMDIARQMPGYKFQAVARKRFFDPLVSIPDNVQMHWDTTLEEYFTLLSQSELVLIPIKDIYNPAGLLLLFDSITLNKLVVSTDTPFLTPYVGEYKSLLCFRKAEEAATKIKNLKNYPAIEELKNALQQRLKEANANAFVTQHLKKIYQLSEPD